MTKKEREVCVICSMSIVEGNKVKCSEGIQVKDCPIQKQEKDNKQ